MKSLHTFFAILSICSIVLLSSCSKDDDNTPVIENEEEVITSLIYTLVPDNGGDGIVLSFRDLDGDGGDAPIVNTSSPLAQNTAYQGTLVLLNESVVPAEEINGEIIEEDEDHQFFFQSQGSAGINVSYDDQDSDGNPIGLQTRLQTTDATQGQLIITLRHEPKKTADGVKNGLIENAGGETDIEVSFDLTVE